MSASFNQIAALSNLTAPASGSTHAAKFGVVIGSGGGVATINMQSQMEFLGPFIGQAMTVDNTLNSVPVTVSETTYGWQRTVPAGFAQTFQYPAVQNQIFTFATSQAATITVSYYDWPAFPDSASLIVSNATGLPVTVTGTVAVTQSTSPWVTQQVAGTPTNPSVFTVTTGGTAVAALAAGSMVNGGFLKNPQTATALITYDPVNTAQATEPGTNGTTAALYPGDSVMLPPSTKGLSVNAPNNGQTFTAWSF